MDGVLYHGSNNLIVGNIEPRVSFDYKKYVYATDDFYYALVRAGKFTVENFALKEDYAGANVPFRIIELKPNAFAETFDTPGYVYGVSKNCFQQLNQTEFVSVTPVHILRRIFIPNVWKTILVSKGKYELIEYQKSTSYWDTVRGGRDGYLQRRTDRLSKLQLVKE